MKIYLILKYKQILYSKVIWASTFKKMYFYLQRGGGLPAMWISYQGFGFRDSKLLSKLIVNKDFVCTKSSTLWPNKDIYGYYIHHNNWKYSTLLFYMVYMQPSTAKYIFSIPLVCFCWRREVQKMGHNGTYRLTTQ